MRVDFLVSSNLVFLDTKDHGDREEKNGMSIARTVPEIFAFKVGKREIQDPLL